MGCLCGGGETTQSQSGTSSGTSSGTFNRTTRPYIPGSWQNSYDSTLGSLSPTGQTPNQIRAGNRLNGLLDSDLLEGGIYRADGAVREGQNLVNEGANYLRANQNISANTLGANFGDGPRIAAAPTSNAGVGADFMSRYQNPWQKDVIDSSLADYDEGVGQEYARFRGANAGAFANKRLGVAESQFGDAAARGRGALSSGLRAQGFNTAAGYGMSDADRRLSADATNAANTIDVNKYNAGIQDSREKFDIGQADTGVDRRLGIARDLTTIGGNMPAIGAASLDARLRGLAGLSGLAGDSANLENMSLSQLLNLLQIGQGTFGSDDSGTTNETTNETSTGTIRGKQPGNLFGTLAGVALAGGPRGLNFWR